MIELKKWLDALERQDLFFRFFVFGSVSLIHCPALFFLRWKISQFWSFGYKCMTDLEWKSKVSPELCCKTQKCFLEPFSELRKVWWSCKLCLSILSENKTTKVSLADFIQVIVIYVQDDFLVDKQFWCCCYGMASGLRLMVEFLNDGLLNVFMIDDEGGDWPKDEWGWNM